MAEHLCALVSAQQILQQMPDAPFLSLSARVGGLSLRIEAPFVADADGVGIVARCVCSHLRLVAPDVNTSVPGHVVVIAAALPAERTVVLVQPLEREVAVAPAGRAVNHNQIDLSHKFPES